MSTNYVQPGECLTLTAPYDVASGAGALIGGEIFGVATATIASGADGEFCTCGVFDLAKLNTQVWAKNDPIYWDVTNKRADNTPGVGPRIGTAQLAAANPTLTGRVVLCGYSPRPKLQAVQTNSVAPTSYATAGNATITAAQVLSGVIVRDCGGGARTDTLPTAALLVAAVPNAKVGDLIRCTVINGSDAAEALTIAEGAGGTWDTNFVAAKAVAQNAARELIIRLTNVTASSEAYVVYLG